MRKEKQENYLDKKPVRADIQWDADENGNITLHVENKGAMNKIAQAVFKKPKISYIHLDEMGNFIWPLLDGEKDITEIGKAVKEHFGDKAEPLYERLAKYIQTLESYRFVEFKE
jgi:hypothetical protein